jgi:cyclic pyranopterin monophosphate synthase
MTGNEEPKERLLSHVDDVGKAHMVDVTAKVVSVREAEARASVLMSPATLHLVQANSAVKGDVLGVARIAGIMAAKRTAELIPLCHGLAITGAELDFELNAELNRVDITARVRSEGKTGVEMEALTAVTVASLTIYDMCKSVDRSMTIERVRLTRKSGGRSGTYEHD